MKGTYRRRLHYRWISNCLIAVGAVWAAPVGAIDFETISFEQLAPGVVVTNQYASSGVQFSLVASPSFPDSPLPPPAGPMIWSVGAAHPYGIVGNAIVAGPTVNGPFYDVVIEFSQPIGELEVYALGVAGVPLKATAYSGALPAGASGVPNPAASQVYGLYFSANDDKLIDRVVISGAQQLDQLGFIPAVFEVSGGGSFSASYQDYVAHSEFSFKKTVLWHELFSLNIDEFELLAFTVNGVTSSGSGDVSINDNGSIDGASFSGPFRWAFGDDSVFFANNEFACTFGGREYGDDPRCHEIRQTLNFDFYSDLQAVEAAGVKLNAFIVAGCKNVTGTVTLPRPAPASGKVVRFTDSLAAATLPLSVTIPAGELSKSFTIKTTPVAVSQLGTVSAIVDGIASIPQRLLVRPMGLMSLSLAPNTVVGSNLVASTAKLECKAGPGPVTVDLTSSNPAVANPIAASIVVPQGLQSETFTLTTTPVQSKTLVTIKATANEISKSRTLSVISAASVTPTSLKFGNQVVNTTSRVLTATLYNKGAVPYSVLGITLTGTNAKYFAQSNNCPANLAAGASCTIGVTFAPTVTGTKTASLVISTSAKSSPLKVYPSGTGVLAP